MKKHFLFLGFLIFIFMLGTPSVNCQTPDTWARVTSLKQLDGTWNGSGVVMDETFSQEFISMFLLEFGKEVNVQVTYDITMTFYAKEPKFSALIKAILDLQGNDIDDTWEEIKDVLVALIFSSGENVELNDKECSITMIYEIPPISISSDFDVESWSGAIQINQDGTKIKIIEDLLGEDIGEFVLTKQ